ncbi:MAG: hypothetical protein GEU90_10980 [Gemmatimonas sp.]|nr:hypothetical protein [Gemmatimonas sp.]
MAFPQSSAINPRRCRGSFSTLLLAILVVGFGARPAGAQLVDGGRLSAVPSFGMTTLTGELANYLSPGPGFGLQVLYQLMPRVSAGVEVAFDSYEGARSPETIYQGPPTQVLRYGIGAEVALVPPQPGGITVSVGGGAGLATMFSEKLYNPAAPGGLVGGPGQTEHSATPLQFGGTYPSFNGLVRLGYVVDPTITLFVEGMGFTSSVDEEKTVVFIQGPYPVARVGENEPLVFDEVGPLTAPDVVRSVGIRLGLRKAL